MSGDVDTTIRGPNAFELSRRVMDDLERRGMAPTAVNYELWTHFLGHPGGALAQEIERLLSEGEVITDTLADSLASAHLPRARLTDQIREAGEQLNKELDAVAVAIKQAQKSSERYGQTLAVAGNDLDARLDPADVKQLVETLSAATRIIQRENQSLEQRLDESTAEVGRLRDHLEQVRRDATTDALTKLANRKGFDDALDRVCEQAMADGQPLCLAVIDIDHFKKFNDTWGHQTGDQVLRYVAGVIARMAPSPRFAARYGGEEFAMIFPREQVSEVLKTLESIRQEVASRQLKRRSTNDDLGTITLSSGLAEWLIGETADELVGRADAALYASKHAGRNRVTLAADAAQAA
jgi:diguanylate cyclase